MTLLSKTALLAAGLIASTPAMARDHRGHRDGIDAGDVIAGALIIGGIAAIATAASNGGNRYGSSYGRFDDDSRRGYDRGYSANNYDSRTAVDQCVRAAQRDARRYGWARVTDVTSIDRVRGGYEVRGRLVVEDRGNDRRGYGRGGYDRGNNYDRYNDGYDKGRFSCTTRYGRIDDVNLSGLKGGSYYR